jgi:hypothetical protein
MTIEVVLMRIETVFRVKGRGTVAVVHPENTHPIKVGMLVHQDDLSWKITGIEMASPPPKNGTIGLLLSPLAHEEDPIPGPLEL